MIPFVQCHHLFASCVSPDVVLKKTVLFDWHKANGGKMVPFAGYDMPVQYTAGIMNETRSCRETAGIFDVSHMRQIRIHGSDRESFLQKLVVADVPAIPTGSIQYSLITNPSGGVIDDTLITRFDDHIYMVLNAGCADKDIAHLRNQVHLARDLGKDVLIEELLGHSLLSIQGPKSAALIEPITTGLQSPLKDTYFLNAQTSSESNSIQIGNIPVYQISRSGYTGEDGFEISVENQHAVQLAETLASLDSVNLCGLGSRDALRLEAGLPLYGNELEMDINPLRATLLWTIPKNRRTKDAGYLGDQAIGHLIENKKFIPDKRVGFMIDKGGIAREGAPIFEPGTDRRIGTVSSGSFSPCLKKGIGMGFILKKSAQVDTPLEIEVRGKRVGATVKKLPLVPNGYYTKK